MTELHYESLSTICARIKSGELNAMQVTESALARIDTLEGELRAYAKVLADSAHATAERLDRERREGQPLGALHGVPIAVKDLLYTRGIATASGTTVMADFVPEEDATVVERLKAAGAVLIGKTQLTEGAYGVHHPDIAAPRNPWNHDRWTGVSSSGSGVAVAAGLAFGALGSDTGGSIRFPSASCGVVGIKPTYGRVSRHGAFPLAESLDHIGPMTRSVADAARMLQVIAGEDPRDPTTLAGAVPNYAASVTDALPGLRVGIDWDYITSGVDDEVVTGVRTALEALIELGAQTVEVQMPSAYQRLVTDWYLTCSVECARAHEKYFPARRDEYGPVLAHLIDVGLNTRQEEYDAVEAVRASFTAELDALLETVDVLLIPAMSAITPTVREMTEAAEEPPQRADFLTFTAPFDYSGHPTLTLPAGLAADGMPKSVQLIGRRLGEPTLVRTGSALEQALAFEAHPLP